MLTKKGGFTLLEILITLIILTSGVVAITWAFSAGMFATTDVENVDLALNIAQAKMEDVFQALKSANFASLDEATFEANNSGADSDFSDFSVSVALADDEDPMQADVTVTWDTKGGQAKVVLTALVTD